VGDQVGIPGYVVKRQKLLEELDEEARGF